MNAALDDRCQTRFEGTNVGITTCASRRDPQTVTVPLDPPLNTPLEGSPAAPAPFDMWLARARWAGGWAARVAEFGFVQCWVQLLAGVAGILIIRTLSKEHYAQYAIVNQMQTACNLLADLGIGIGIRSIGGRVWHDQRRMGSLVNTALGLRKWFALASLACCLPVAAWMLAKAGATGSAVIVLCGVIVASVVPLLTSSVMLVVPQFHGEYRRIQKLDLSNAVVRLALVGALAATRLNAALAAAVAAVGNWIQLAFTRRWAHEHSDANAAPNVEDRRELMRLSVRTLPNMLFFCFQGQVTLFILIVAGNPTGIADLTALGRLGILLTAFSAAVSNVLVPRFARCQDPIRLPKLYLLVVSATIPILASIVAVGWLYPKQLLWLLGSKYVQLEAECGLAVTTACIAQLVSLMWNMNVCRAWIYFQSRLFIPSIVLVQVVASQVLDLRELRGVLWFALASTLAPFPLYVLDAFRALRRPITTV